MCPVVRPSCVLLLFSLLAACARAQFAAQLGVQEETYALRDGSASGRARVHFALGEGLIDPTHNYLPQVDFNDAESRRIVEVVDARFRPEQLNSFMTVQISMNSFPGHAMLNCSVLLPSGVREYVPLSINVVGVVLFDEKQDVVYTGKNARALRLSSDTVTTVDARVFNAPQSLTHSVPMGGIRLRLRNPRYKYLLPWDHQACSINAPPASLSDNCSMAFSSDFTKFSFRIPSASEFMTPLTLSNRIEVVFEWALAAHLPSSNTELEPSERTDDFTTVQLRYPTVRRRISALPGWKIAMITVISILGSVTLVIFVSCCICAARHRSADRSSSMQRKVLVRRFGRHQSSLANMEKRDSFSQIADFLPPPEPRSRSVYSQDTLGRVSDTHAAADDELIPDEHMLAALMARDSEGTVANVGQDGDLTMLTHLDETEAHTQPESGVDDDIELQLEIARSKREGLTGRRRSSAAGAGSGGGAANGGTRTAQDRMAFGAALERMKVVNMLIGPVSRGLISGQGPSVVVDDETEEEDETLRFSSEELDMDLLDVAQAIQGGAAAEQDNGIFEEVARNHMRGGRERHNRTR
eukprot:TRINITY_DN987_c0_g1_i1.p1 TRINITY_DN987_c0_g1~~TRINITY_DN987_c0_g1_i1.p1  ORF type:complete len:601 (+),score=88.66 TRINITY_DN987_c0_g1_i1:56-1804(+)